VYCGATHCFFNTIGGEQPFAAGVLYTRELAKAAIKMEINYKTPWFDLLSVGLPIDVT